MFYCNLEHITKKAVMTRSGKVKNAATAKNRFHYITRTSHFKNYKESVSEHIEFVRSGNMPNFAEGKPVEFWQAADMYERSNGRTCSSLVVAFPKELSQAQRIELAEAFIAEFADRYRFPFTCSIHNHAGSLGGQEQPHLHFMYSERHVDGIGRTPEQFFKRYNPKQPEKGGAQKLTADVLGMGKAQLQLYRQKTEALINDSLQRYAPTKMVEIRGIQVEVPSLVSCLSHADYNKKYGTHLHDVPMLHKGLRFATECDPIRYQQKQEMIAEIHRLRSENNYALYRSFYEAELKNRRELEALKKQVETPRTRQRWYAQEKLLFLQKNMRETLLEEPQAAEPMRLIQQDLQRYIDLLNTDFFDRSEKLKYLKDLNQNLEGSVRQIATIDEELAFMQQQVIECVPLTIRQKAITSEKIRNQDQDNDFSPGF